MSSNIISSIPACFPLKTLVTFATSFHLCLSCFLLCFLLLIWIFHLIVVNSKEPDSWIKYCVWFYKKQPEWPHPLALPPSVTESSCCARSCQFLTYPCSGVWLLSQVCSTLSLFFVRFCISVICQPWNSHVVVFK